ncbi:MAG: flagellar hook-associated protein FlgK [Polyangiaceae bacterium]
MSGLFSLLGIARDGLEAHGAALLVTGQNVTQANVAGYVRKTAVFETRPGTTGGVHVAGVARHFDRFTFGRLLGESGQKSEAFARSSALDAVEGVLAPETGSIAERLAAFEASMRALGADASNPSLRSVALSDAAALATSVSTTAAGLARASDDTFTKAVGVAQDLEGRLATIATLNRRIAEATGAGNDASDLRDERDRTLRSVAEAVGGTALEDARGSVTVFAGGVALVEGDASVGFTVAQDPTGAMTFVARRPNGTTLDLTTTLQGGTLGGLKRARDVTLSGARKDLDLFAEQFASAVNAVHTVGFATDGSSGRNLFTAVTGAGAAYAMALDPALVDRPDRLALSTSAASVPGGGDNAFALANVTLPSGDGPLESLVNLVTIVGISKRDADSDAAMRTATSEQAARVHEASSGVSLDEETVNLTKFQRAFEASTRVLRAADELLQGLLQEF